MKYLSFDYVVYNFITILFVCVIAFALGTATTQAVALVYFILALSLVFVTDIYIKKELM